MAGSVTVIRVRAVWTSRGRKREAAISGMARRVVHLRHCPEGCPMPARVRRLLLAALLAAASAFPGAFVSPAAAQQAPELKAAIAKSNAYINLMNRTLRAVSSWNRYTSWVNLRTGPTGRERYITYGLYSLYDTRGEIEKARAATTQEPLVPELDATVLRYVDAYEALAPVITQAAAYYERQDYKDDRMAEGKALHVRLVPAAEAFLRERAALEAQMRSFKRDLDRKDLDAIEASEGRKGRWHVKTVMMNAAEVIEALPSQGRPVVDMKAFDALLAAYAAAVREFDGYVQANPGQLSSFESQPRSLLGKLREFRDALARSKGDVRRGAGQDMMWIVNQYNSMISSSQMATRFSR
jgi:hypothetical protein